MDINLQLDRSKKLWHAIAQYSDYSEQMCSVHFKKVEERILNKEVINV